MNVYDINGQMEVLEYLRLVLTCMIPKRSKLCNSHHPKSLQRCRIIKLN